MCAGANGDHGERGERILSTTNRTFEKRQGPVDPHDPVAVFQGGGYVRMGPFENPA